MIDRDDKPLTSKRRWRWWQLALAAYAIAYAVWYWPFINPRWNQDRCVFGAVSNDGYRAMLARRQPIADAVPPVVRRRRLAWGEPHAFQDYLFAASKNAKTNDEFVASIHASMRALGAWYTGHRLAPPNNKHLTYQIHQGKVDLWPPAALRMLLYATGPLTAFVGFPWARIVVLLGRNQTDDRLSIRLVEVSVTRWDISGPNYRYFRRFIKGGCPKLLPLLK